MKGDIFFLVFFLWFLDEWYDKIIWAVFRLNFQVFSENSLFLLTATVVFSFVFANSTKEGIWVDDHRIASLWKLWICKNWLIDMVQNITTRVINDRNFFCLN